MSKYLFVPMGSSGDVNPFIGIGTGLKHRGHDVTIITNEHFEKAIEEAGLEFARLGSCADYDRAIGHPDFWDPKKSVKLFFEFTLASMPEAFERVATLHDPGETIVAGPPWAAGAHIAAEKFGLPVATIFPNPLMMRSAYSPPKTPLMPIPRWLGSWGVRALYYLLDLKLNRLVSEPINAFRKSQGLAAAKNAFRHWRDQSDRIIGLWPEWLYAPQPDWAPQAVVTGFIEYDGSSTVSATNPQEEVQSAIRADDKPIVFTYGTAMAQGRDFFHAAAQACRILHQPGLLVTQRPRQTPDSLPPDVRHLTYAPFAQLLPKAAALVHHGGIGTAARAVKAGIPQLIVPASYDQFDNAERFGRLGIAASLARSKLNGTSLAETLRQMQQSGEMFERCRGYAARLDCANALEQTCNHIESLLVPGSSPAKTDNNKAS